MQFIRNHRKASIIVMVALSILLIFGVTYAKYFYNIVHNYILETRNFYFNSSALSINGRSFNINNWDGANAYTLTVDVNSKKNEEKSTNSDIDYSIELSCPNTVSCTSNKDSGTIYQSSKMDSFHVTVSPKNNHHFYAGDEVKIVVKAVSSYPYRKIIYATYVLSVEKSNFTYNIEDNTNDLFMVLNLTNEIAYYQAEMSFGKYSSGDKITADDYFNLDAASREKCFSAKVTLTFDPNEVLLDMTSSSYLHRVSGSEHTVSIGGYDYVNSYTFKLDATANEKIIFYKVNRTENYTYPIVNNDSIVGVSVVLAE